MQQKNREREIIWNVDQWMSLVFNKFFLNVVEYGSFALNKFSVFFAYYNFLQWNRSNNVYLFFIPNACSGKFDFILNNI